MTKFLSIISLSLFLPLASAQEKRLTFPISKESPIVDKAIKSGIAFLRKHQQLDGSWLDSSTNNRYRFPVGFTSLVGLTLLECGIPKTDPGVQAAASFVRKRIAEQPLSKTYEISLAVIFLVRLGEGPRDHELIRTLALRLAAGQTELGGWTYNCPILTPVQEKKLVEILSNRTTRDLPGKLPPTGPKGEKADNSNTQFALLALWAAKDFDLPLEFTLALCNRRFQESRMPGGWNYQLHSFPGRTRIDPYGSMTCVGLLGLAVGYGLDKDGRKLPRPDDDIALGLKILGYYMMDPTDSRATVGLLGPKGVLNFYFLWSVERVAVLYDLPTIGGKDWYGWGATLILRTQKADGSWLGRGAGPRPVVDTSFALLFLRKSDLLPDLRVTLKKRLRITDHWLDGKTLDPKSFPGGLPTPYRPGENGSLQERLPPGLRPRPNDPPRLGSKGKE